MGGISEPTAPPDAKVNLSIAPYCLHLSPKWTLASGATGSVLYLTLIVHYDPIKRDLDSNPTGPLVLILYLL
jgi:hypothetical protein